MVVYDARRGGGKRRIRWKRVALWTFGSLLILLLAIGGVVGYWAHGLVGQISHLDKSTQDAQGDLVQIPTANQAAVGLVIGSDKRQGDGVNDSRSDTLMLVRIDPQTHYISLLSLPRDLWVDIPGYGESKINAAYETGGVKLALKTVESVTGVDVNYLMVVDFSGFTRLVNAFGGVYVPVDQYYQHTNTPGTEQYAQIDVKPGYQLLHGTDALGFARYRHTDSDFYRNARQQTFLQAFQARASEKLHGIDLTEIGTYKDIAETIADSVQVTGRNGPPSVQTMISYATLAYESRGHVVSTRLVAGAGMIGDASVVTTTPEDMHTAVYQFTHPQALAKPTVPTGKKPANTPKFKPAVDPAGVSLTSVNGNGRTGSAAKAGAALHRFGYQVDVSQVPAPTFDYSQNWVYFHPGQQKAATDVAKIMGNAQTAPLPAAFTYGTDLVVIVGKPFTGKTAIAPPKQSTPTGLPADIVRDSQAYLSYFETAKRSLHFPVLYPTVQQTGSQFDDFTPEMPIRTYNIAAAGKGWNSMYAVFAMPNLAGAYWGIEETRFVDAPILASPDLIRKLDGRSYKFYFNGTHIHMIAIVQGGVAYWVQNTLRDDLSNPDMIAIARSLRPA